MVGVGGEFSNNQIRVLLKVGTALSWKLKAWGGQWVLPVKVTTEFKASKNNTNERTNKKEQQYSTYDKRRNLLLTKRKKRKLKERKREGIRIEGPKTWRKVRTRY